MAGVVCPHMHHCGSAWVFLAAVGASALGGLTAQTCTAALMVGHCIPAALHRCLRSPRAMGCIGGLLMPAFSTHDVTGIDHCKVASLPAGVEQITGQHEGMSSKPWVRAGTASKRGDGAGMSMLLGVELRSCCVD
jgi:hypothetical protein